MWVRVAAVVCGGAVASASACAGPGEPLPVDAGLAAWPARCEARVAGVGAVDVERDYLPRVVACENGAGDMEALKAQAVAARSYLYQRLEATGRIVDGTRDQVYTCGRPPSRAHRAAVAATDRQILTHAGDLVAGFFVAGALPDDQVCAGGDDDPYDTEQYVTYNEGNAGGAVEPTALGAPDPWLGANRGALSQNGANCLAERGWRYDRILRFYYGDDVAIVQAGDCAGGAEPEIADARGGRAPDRDELLGGLAIFMLWVVALALADRWQRGRARRPVRRRPRRRTQTGAKRRASSRTRRR